jgi:hypothetical protein
MEIVAPAPRRHLARPCGPGGRAASGGSIHRIRHSAPMLLFPAVNWGYRPPLQAMPGRAPRGSPPPSGDAGSSAAEVEGRRGRCRVVCAGGRGPPRAVPGRLRWGSRAAAGDAGSSATGVEGRCGRCRVVRDGGRPPARPQIVATRSLRNCGFVSHPAYPKGLHRIRVSPRRVSTEACVCRATWQNMASWDCSTKCT